MALLLLLFFTEIYLCLLCGIKGFSYSPCIFVELYWDTLPSIMAAITTAGLPGFPASSWCPRVSSQNETDFWVIPWSKSICLAALWSSRVVSIAPGAGKQGILKKGGGVGGGYLRLPPCCTLSSYPIMIPSKLMEIPCNWQQGGEAHLQTFT